MSTKVQIVSQQVPSSFCPISNDDWQSLVALLSGNVSGDPNFNTGNAVPSPSNRSKYWLRDNSDGTPDRVYRFAQGAWLANHGVATGLITLYTGLEADLDTLDGGEAGAVTILSGPMWQKVAALNAKFPLGIGTLASGTVIAPLDTGGEEKHSLDATEMPPHDHGMPLNNAIRLANGGNADVGASGGSANKLFQSAGGTGTPPVVVAHNNMPPYCGVIFIAKSARRFYRINA